METSMKIEQLSLENHFEQSIFAEEGFEKSNPENFASSAETEKFCSGGGKVAVDKLEFKHSDTEISLMNMKTTRDDLSYLRSDMIHNRLLQLSGEERKITAELIEYLAEVDSRKIYAELGYGSMFSYVTQALKYSEGSAYRRIEAARLFQKIPVIKQKIESGSLNLTQLSQVRGAIKRSEKENSKKISTEETSDILESLENLSKKESEKELAEKFNLPPIEFTRTTAKKGGSFDIQFSLTEEQMKLIEKTKNHFSHAVPTLDIKDPIIYFCERNEKDIRSLS